jgi:hypothetical protein
MEKLTNLTQKKQTPQYSVGVCHFWKTRASGNFLYQQKFSKICLAGVGF